jgi:hypothetical protein
MCSECNDHSYNDWIELDCNGNKLLIAKIANANDLPSGDFKGKTELLKSTSGTNKNFFLFYIFVSHKDKGLKLKYSDFLSTTKIQTPDPVFRMPDSPYHFFVLIDIKHPGVVTLTDSSGTDIIIKLTEYNSALVNLKFLRQDTKIAFQKINNGLFRKIKNQ